MNDRHTSAGDLALRDLRRFKPTCREPHDFDAFWSKQLEGARASANTPTTVTEASTPLRTIRSWSVSFPGWGGQPIAAWLHAPTGSDGPLPCVVEYSGYGQGRGLVHERTLYAQAGYAHLVIDARGQNGATERCDTPDLGPWAVDTASVMTRGLARPEEMYLTRLIVDAARAVDAAQTFEVVDPRRVAVAGISQGGGLAIITAGLVADVAAVCADVPFLCHIWRGVALSTTGLYTEIRAHLAMRPELTDLARATLSYVDALHFAQRANAPALFSVAGQDCVCPPSTVFAVFNHYAGPKDIRVWPFNAHEGGGGLQAATRIDFLRETLDEVA